MRILVVHGPNLNLLGRRQPEVYGRQTLSDIDEVLRRRAADLGVEASFFQANGEGQIVDYLQAEAPTAQGIVINPAALTHYGLSLRDTLAAIDLPIVEVHLSNVYAREEFRHRSVTAPVISGQISGLGWRGYRAALEIVVEMAREEERLMQKRLQSLRRRLAEADLPALLVSQPQNRRYLSGFTGSAGFLLISANQALLATDFRYVEQAAAQAPSFSVERIREGLAPLLPELMAHLQVSRLGFESGDLTVAAYAELAAAAEARGLQLEPTTGLVEEMRTVKDAQELDCIERAVALADKALVEVVAGLRPGLTEREVAWDLERRMRERGADGLAFEIIVASGPASALPHARPTNRALRAGEPIVIDMGAYVDGYVSDLTRTVALGDPDDTFRRVYALVLQAQQAALAGLRPGMTGREGDALARRVIEEAGYGEAFGHGLGHGVGLVVHEQPGVRRTSEEKLEAGMVFSVEPGVYLPGWGGVRIEDLVVLEEDGARVLSRAPK